MSIDVYKCRKLSIDMYWHQSIFIDIDRHFRLNVCLSKMSINVIQLLKNVDKCQEMLISIDRRYRHWHFSTLLRLLICKTCLYSFVHRKCLAEYIILSLSLELCIVMYYPIRFFRVVSDCWFWVSWVFPLDCENLLFASNCK
jgi:hypothetical protein